MADNRQTPSNEIPAASVEDRAVEFWYALAENWKKNQSTWLTAIAIVVCAAGAWGFWAWKSGSAEADAHRLVGRGYIYLDNGRTDSALATFEKVLSGYTGIEASKAALQLGDHHFAKADYATALAKYQRARVDGKGLPLLEGGALRGVAACQIQLKKYAEAETALRTLLGSFQRLTGNAEERATEREPQDLVPGLSQPMWQLVLVQEKLGRMDDAVRNAKSLCKLYPASREAGEASRWLALNGISI